MLFFYRMYHFEDSRFILKFICVYLNGWCLYGYFMQLLISFIYSTIFIQHVLCADRLCNLKLHHTSQSRLLFYATQISWLFAMQQKADYYTTFIIINSCFSFNNILLHHEFSVLVTLIFDLVIWIYVFRNALKKYTFQELKV